MNTKFLNILALICFIFPISVISSPASTGKVKLTGITTDKQTGEPLAGVAIYIPELKTGAISGDDGSYKIENLPRTKIFTR